MNSHEKVAMKREAGAVTRWHTLPHHGVDTVANHSWNATMLLLELRPEASRALIVYMLNHDVTERWTGDIPANSKGMFPLISKGVGMAEEWLENKFDIPSARNLDESERRWARAIDAVESAIWCREQMMMGNQMVVGALEAIDKWIMDEGRIPASLRFWYQNYKWKRTAGYITEGKHYGSNEDGVPRSYSDLDIDHHPETIKGRTEVHAHAEKYLPRSHKCKAHIPDAKCDCDRCQAMAKIATPHIDGCQCSNCAEVRKEAARAQLRELDGIDKREAKAIHEAIAKTAKARVARRGHPTTIKGVPSSNKTLHVRGQLIEEDSAEHADLEACRKEQHRKVCHGLDCDDPAHELRTDRKRKGPVTTIINEIDHPAGCDCVICKGVRAVRRDKAKARGCGLQCGCNDCLADYYLEQKHE